MLQRLRYTDILYPFYIYIGTCSYIYLRRKMFHLNTWLCVLSFWEIILSIQSYQVIRFKIDPFLDTDTPDTKFPLKELPFDTFYKKCAPRVKCNPNDKYRSFDGTCNNLENVSWGASKTPYIRVAPATYSDGDHAFRKQSNGKDLPGPRDLQLAIFLQRSFDFPDHSNYHVNQFLQWIIHDVTRMNPDDTLGFINCCDVQNQLNIPAICQAVIKIPSNDPVYSAMKKTCMQYTRVKTATNNLKCPISPQIQVDDQTSYLDASILYGANNDEALSVRSLKGGKLKTDFINGQEYTFQQQRNTSMCNGRNNVSKCMTCADNRCLQHFGLIIYHQSLARFHNTVADKLHKVNQEWPDEILFQESRRIVIAVIQISAFRELVPIVIGDEYATKVGLTLFKDQKTAYNASLMPQLPVELVAGALRVLHNSVPPKYYFLDNQNHVVNDVFLTDYMADPDLLVQGSNFDEVLRGMSLMSGRLPLSSYSYPISNFINHNMLSSVADLDLFCIDLQRSRDSGGPTYCTMRNLCGFPKLSTFDDLIGVLHPSDIELLKDFYATVHDVDFFVGALMEPLCPNAMVGPSVRCLLTDGFTRIRNADRYFVDVVGQPGSFSKEQYDVLFNFNLKTIFCEVTKVHEFPKKFFSANWFSETESCPTQELNLDAWCDSTIPGKICKTPK